MLLGGKLDGPSAQDDMAHHLQKKSWFNFNWLKQIKISFSLTFDLFIFPISFWITGEPLDQLLCLLSPPFISHMSETLNSCSMGKRRKRQQYHLGMTFWEQAAPLFSKGRVPRTLPSRGFYVPQSPVLQYYPEHVSVFNSVACLFFWKKPPWQFYIDLICST